MAIDRIGYNAFVFTDSSELSDLPYKDYEYEKVENEPFQFNVSYENYYIESSGSYIKNTSPIWDATKKYYIKYAINDIPYGAIATFTDGEDTKKYIYTSDNSAGTNGWIELV